MGKRQGRTARRRKFEGGGKIMSERAKHLLSVWSSIFVIVSSIVIMLAFMYAWTGVLWIVAIFNLISGPACLIAYIREVRKGVFAVEAGEVKESELADEGEL